MQRTRCKASGLAVTDVEVAKSEASFLKVQYSLWNSGHSCFRYNSYLAKVPVLLTGSVFFALLPVAGVLSSRLPIPRCLRFAFFFSFLAFSEASGLCSDC